MLFPTLAFAIFFLIGFSLHWLLVRRPLAWKPFMLSASYVFYGWWDWRFLVLIAACTITSHLATVAMARSERPALRRLFLILALAFNLGVLGFFKYYGFFATSLYQLCGSLSIPCSLPLLDIVLPVGISFFTFQALSYVVDVYRRQMDPARRLIDFAIYISFFPQLVAGPIVRASHYFPQLYHIMDVRRIDVGRAALLILGGLFKKVVIANYLAEVVVDPVFAHAGAFQGPDSLLAVYGYAVQVYCDFSAYSDIAIGSAALLGFNFPENFNAPYFATSVREFWHRWHISLSTWLRDYVFFSLYSTRLGRLRFALMINTFITFMLGGLWHGATWTFVMWGALHSTYLIGEDLLVNLLVRMRGGRPLPDGSVIRFCQRLVVFHLICISFVFFRARSFTDGGILLQKVFSSWNVATLLTIPTILMLITGFLTQFMDGKRMEPVWNWYNRLPVVGQGLVAAVALTIILALGPQGVAPFIYFQF